MVATGHIVIAAHVDRLHSPGIAPVCTPSNNTWIFWTYMSLLIKPALDQFIRFAQFCVPVTQTTELATSVTIGRINAVHTM